jgi:hypothetical protein
MRVGIEQRTKNINSGSYPITHQMVHINIFTEYKNNTDSLLCFWKHLFFWKVSFQDTIFVVDFYFVLLNMSQFWDYQVKHIHYSQLLRKWKPTKSREFSKRMLNYAKSLNISVKVNICTCQYATTNILYIVRD